MTVEPVPSRRHLALVGPTASGKSALAMEVAEHLGDIEIVSADSMQVYRGMDIGTAKPTVAEQGVIPHHLLDLADPSEHFSLARYRAAARPVLAGIEQRGRRALLVGGSGLYVQAVVDDFDTPGRWPDVRVALEAEPDTWSLHRRLYHLDPLAASRMEPTNRRRVVRALEVTLGSGRPFSSFGPGVGAYPPTRFDVVGLAVPTPVLHARIDDRLRSQIGDGLLDEVRGLLGAAGLGRTARQALGYRELLGHLERGVPLEAAVDEAGRRTRAFCRRQRAWFRRDPRITWLDHDGEPLALTLDLVARWAGRRSTGTASHSRAGR